MVPLKKSGDDENTKKIEKKNQINVSIRQGLEAGYSVSAHSGRLVLLWSTMKIWIVSLYF